MPRFKWSTVRLTKWPSTIGIRFVITLHYGSRDKAPTSPDHDSELTSCYHEAFLTWGHYHNNIVLFYHDSPITRSHFMDPTDRAIKGFYCIFHHTVVSNSLGCIAAIRCGNACHGPHSNSVYSGSEHRQFNSPRLVKREAGFPNPRRVMIGSNQPWRVNTLRPGQNERHFPDDIFKCIFLNENVRISFKISLKFVPEGPINNIPVLVQMMAWRRPGDKPLSEQMLVSLLMHKCVTQPQWVNDPPYYRVFNPGYSTAGHNVFQDNSH